MAQPQSRRERLLLAVVVLSAVIVVADIIMLNVVGDDLPSGWWPVAVPVGLFLVPVVGAVCLVALLAERRGTSTTL